MQHLEEAADEALAIGGHLISGRGQKPLFGEQCASIFRGLTESKEKPRRSDGASQ
ncbi:MAG: hypothetical protein WBK19_02835 [Azonexus sp.]|jgi:hypothetical protein